MKGFLERIQAGETLVGDGAWGTQLMARGLQAGESPEAINLSNPGVLAEIAALYVDAGADLITTNTFGGSSLRLKDHGLDDRTEKINRAAVAAIAPVVADRAYVAGSMGPTGKILEPYGDTAPEIVAEAFERQAGALVEAGADLIVVETMIDLREAELAIKAVRSASAEIPLIATMTFRCNTARIFHHHGIHDRAGLRCPRRCRGK